MGVQVTFMAGGIDEIKSKKPLSQSIFFAGWDEPDRPELRLLEHLHGSPPALRRRPDPDGPRKPGGPLFLAAGDRRAATRAPRRQPRPAGLHR